MHIFKLSMPPLKLDSTGLNCCGGSFYEAGLSVNGADSLPCKAGVLWAGCVNVIDDVLQVVVLHEMGSENTTDSVHWGTEKCSSAFEWARAENFSSI